MDWLRIASSSPKKQEEQLEISCPGEEKNIPEIKKKNRTPERPIRSNIIYKERSLPFDLWEYHYFPQLVRIFKIMERAVASQELTIKREKESFRDFNRLLYEKSSKEVWDEYLKHPEEIELSYQEYHKKNEQLE